MRWRSRVLLFQYGALGAAGALLSACSASEEGNATPGNLGQAGFVYVCVDATDPACSDAAFSASRDTATVPPEAVAVGSTFGLGYSKTSVPAGNPVFRPVSSTYLGVVNSETAEFKALTAGYGAVYLESTIDSSFVDYTLFHLVVPDTMTLADGAGKVLGSSAVVGSALLGSTADFGVSVSHGTERVGGTMDLVWSVADPSVAEITTKAAARVTVRAKHDGTTTLTVTGAGLSAKATLQVTL